MKKIYINYYIRFIAGLMCCVLGSVTYGQTPKYRVLSLPVERSGITLREPWVGGLNSPQFSSIDINKDNHPDLFVFDKVGDKVLTYLNNGSRGDSTYNYAPQFEDRFPADLFSWALIRDYNHDGAPDIFTHANAGSRVYKGFGAGHSLYFDTVSSLLTFDYNGFKVNVWTSLDDIPVFTDVNRDGDIDILSYGIAGSQVEYYENQAVEHTGDPAYALDSFRYSANTLCWGNFAQSSLSNSIALNVSCKGGESTVIQQGGSRHAGNTLYSFDADYDHDVDLLNGNIGYDNLVFLHNGGDSLYANMDSWDSIYPVCSTPILLQTEPAAFGVDVDQDSLEDLLIAPNGRTGARDVRNVMLYKNTGDTACNFTLQSDSFLIHDMLDFGTDSKAVFFDINSDGLQDIIVGNYGYYRQYQTYRSTLAYLENTGTTTHPRFTLRDDDFANMDSYNLVGVNPAFGDLDGDGRADMIVGELTGVLHFFKNTGGAMASFPAMTRPFFDTLDIGQYSAPFIYDMNGDSINDLVVGKRDGNISYFWNMGTRTAPLFHKDSVNKFFGNVNVTLPGYIEGYSQPFILKDNSGAMKLFVGSNRGSVFEYQIDAGNLRGGTFNLIDSDFIQYDAGSKSTMAIADLNGDGKFEYAVGNSRGGILLYSDSVWDPGIGTYAENITKSDNILNIYPNPSNDYFICTYSTGEFVNPSVELYNALGEKVNTPSSSAKSSFAVNTSTLLPGFYLVRVFDGSKSHAAPILIVR